ncbi:MAG: Ig-like domain-containing protein [Armatimonadota bacterium]
MNKGATVAFAAVLLASIAHQADAATWTKLGTSGYTTTPTFDSQRINFGSIAVDSAGNTWVTANNTENSYYDYVGGNATPVLNARTGGVTVFKAAGGQLDINLSNSTDPHWGTEAPDGWKSTAGRTDNKLVGQITKLVTGADGRVYALLNWHEINWDFQRQNQRIVQLRLDNSGNPVVTSIWSPGAAKTYNATTSTWSDTEHKIRGLTSDPNSGAFIWWTTNGYDGFWKNNFFFNYDGGYQQGANCSGTNCNNGYLEMHRQFDLEYTGVDAGVSQFAVLKSSTDSNWRAEPIWTNQHRGTDLNSSSNPGQGRDWCTGMVWDPVNNRLWAGGRGTVGGGFNNNIMSRWKGQTGATKLFPTVAAADMFHSLNRSEAILPTYAARWWMSGLDTNPTNGVAWMAFNIANSSAALPARLTSAPAVDTDVRGHIVQRDEYLNLQDQGLVESGADVYAVKFKPSGDALALVLNRTTGQYSLYTSGTVVSPPTVTITSPTANLTHTTTSTPLVIGGTASAVGAATITSVTWINNRGGSGTASGTTAWSASIPLQSGQNVITVTATDSNSQTLTDTLTVTYNLPDSQNPEAIISSPTTNATYLTNNSTLNLGGTATDNVGVTQVTYTVNGGASNTAMGTSAWTISGITLVSGVNTIVVTAKDSANNTGSDTITVTLDNTAPTVTVNLASSQPDPAHSAPLQYTLTFSEAVSGLDASDITISGTSGAPSAPTSLTGGPTTYTVSAGAGVNNGTIRCIVATGAATDAAGNPSVAPTNIDNTVYWIGSALTIPAGKQLGDNASANFTSRVVTAVYTNNFYMKDPGVSTGVKVIPVTMPAGLAVGDLVDVAGTIKTDANSERYIDASGLGGASKQTGSGVVVAYTTKNDNVGGASWMYNAGTGAGQKGVSNGVSLNTIGRLMRTSGTVQSTGIGFFVINDGSILRSVKVAVPSGVLIPSIGSFVTVTGACSIEAGEPVLKARSIADIQ